jgi:GNAT superfamily N-acetyltransferase
MSPDVRPVTAADIPALVRLVDQYWLFEDIAGFDPGRVARELARVHEDPRLGSGWIAFARGEAVGYLLAVYVHSLEHLGLTAEIDEFFVLPSARSKGLGEALLRLAEAEFLRRGCTNVALQLGRGNERARLFYRALGYRERAGFDMLDKMLTEHREA